jgi:transcriptional regulator with XRE-family HTH domain
MGAPQTSPRARALSAALREAREQAEIGQRELARQLGIAHPNLSYWERGVRTPAVEDVAAILAKLSITGAQRDRILELARNAAEPNWLTSGVPGMSPGLAGVLDCEQTATAITDWSPLVLPGLLQTSDYARAIFHAGDLPANSVRPRVMMRMSRRDVLTRRNPARLLALIHERAVREVIGDKAVMADQLRHIHQMADHENVTVQVVQSGTGWHPGLAGPFILFDFPSSPSIVHLEHHRSSAFLYDDKDVEDYQAAAATVRGVAMSPADSSELIASVITELETTT